MEDEQYPSPEYKADDASKPAGGELTRVLEDIRVESDKLASIIVNLEKKLNSVLRVKKEAPDDGAIGNLLNNVDIPIPRYNTPLALHFSEVMQGNRRLRARLQELINRLEI